MSLPTRDTVVTYPAGDLRSTGVVLRSPTVEVPGPDSTRIVILDRTACHPVDRSWPDQGPDHATLTCDGTTWPVLDCVVGACDAERLYVGAQIPVRRGTPGWAFVACHVLPADAEIPPGAEVTIEVDPERRRNLSAGHSGCHLAVLALSRELTGAWSKPMREDYLGSPDFDGAALLDSRIGVETAVDRFRLGKSLRRKGFDASFLLDHLAEREQAVEAALAAWVASDAPARIECEGPGLSDLRTWVCDLPERTIRIPCGGTHLSHLGLLSDLRASLEVQESDGATVVCLRTTWTFAD